MVTVPIFTTAECGRECFPVFYPEFSNQRYEERLWPAIQFLEGMMRQEVRLKPQEYAVLPREEMKKRFKVLLDLIEFPPKEMELRDDDFIVDTFIDSEFESIVVAAEDALRRFPDGRGAIEDLFADPSRHANCVRARMRESAMYSESVRQGKILSWITATEARLLKKRDARRKKDEDGEEMGQ